PILMGMSVPPKETTDDYDQGTRGPAGRCDPSPFSDPDPKRRTNCGDAGGAGQGNESLSSRRPHAAATCCQAVKTISEPWQGARRSPTVAMGRRIKGARRGPQGTDRNGLGAYVKAARRVIYVRVA